MPIYFFVLVENAFPENWAPIFNIANNFLHSKTIQIISITIIDH